MMVMIEEAVADDGDDTQRLEGCDGWIVRLAARIRARAACAVVMARDMRDLDPSDALAQRTRAG